MSAAAQRIRQFAWGYRAHGEQNWGPLALEPLSHGAGLPLALSRGGLRSFSRRPEERGLAPTYREEPEGGGGQAAMFIPVPPGHGPVLPPLPPGSHQRAGDGWAFPREAAGCQRRGHQGAAGREPGGRGGGAPTCRGQSSGKGPASLSGSCGSRPRQTEALGRASSWCHAAGKRCEERGVCG